MISYVFSEADRTTAPTLELKKELEAYGVRNVLYMPNGIKLKKFRKTGKKAFMEKYKIPKDRPVVLYVGRVSFEKRLENLMRAFGMVKNATLVMVGSGPLLEFPKTHLLHGRGRFLERRSGALGHREDRDQHRGWGKRGRPDLNPPPARPGPRPPRNRCDSPRPRTSHGR